MSTTSEILALEERLRQAELTPDPKFFEDYISDDAILDGVRNKQEVVDAHRPGGKGHKFTKVVMSQFEIIDHGIAAVVTCTGTYEGPHWSGTLRFMRVWYRHSGRWQIIAASILK